MATEGVNYIVIEYRKGKKHQIGSCRLHEEDSHTGIAGRFLKNACSAQGDDDVSVVALEQGESGPVLNAWICASGVVVHEEGRCDHARLVELIDESREYTQ